jgi:hypothetical protein
MLRKSHRRHIGDSFHRLKSGHLPAGNHPSEFVAKPLTFLRISGSSKTLGQIKDAVSLNSSPAMLMEIKVIIRLSA